MATLSPAARAADEVSGSRSEALVEKGHRVELKLDRGHAELVVRRTVFNGGPRHDQAMFHLELPGGAVATGLATLGVKDGQPFWFRGELMEAEAAAAKYQELTGIGGYYPKDPALLSWRSQTHLALQVFPCAPGQPKTVEYTLRMPTAYSEGRHRLVLPRMGTAEIAPVVVVSPARAGDRIFVGGKPVEPGARVQLAADETEIALAPAPALALDGALASVPIGEAKNLVALRIHAPAQLSRLPKNARVVVLLDASRSLSEAEAEAEVAAARAYLSHLGDALVEVIPFDREVRPRHGRFVSAAAAIADLEKLTLSRRNGSRVDAAFARADALLAATPEGLPRRIVALSDLRTRSALTPARLGALVKSGALVHIGVPEGGAPELARDDEHAWATPVRVTGGLVWRAGASADPDDRAAMARAYEEWARPTRLEKVAVRAAGLDAEALAFFPTELPEGAGLEHHEIHKAPVSEVEITGELWAKPVGAVFRPDAAQGKIWSALVFGSDLLWNLTEAEMMPLAMRGGAVSPVTSYLAIEPGVRPSTEGLDWVTGEGGGGRGEGIGLGSIGTIGHGSGLAPDRERFLRDALEQAFQRCPAGAKTATVSLETTSDEVVDVPAVQLGGAPDAAVIKCLEEAAWELTLPGSFVEAWARYDVRVKR